MREYEDQLIREATGQTRDFEETEPEETNESNETGNQQGEIITEHRCPNCNTLIAGGKHLCHACDLELYEWQQKRFKSLQ